MLTQIHQAAPRPSSGKAHSNPANQGHYEIRVLTPPAIEVDRDVEVLEKLENKHVKLKADIVLKNFAEEAYSNLKFNL